ncbi:hypothetical protein FJ426_17300 [Mesorhizobium sp. B2-6-4]|nr:hypothetical protein FJ426_17300 [Mesorhizobium sp. B2-6-4]
MFGSGTSGRQGATDQIETWCLIRCPCLLAREASHGETEGRKNRPIAVGVRLARPGGDLVLFFPISTKQLEPVRFAVEVPSIEKRRAGLDPDMRLWIILDEFNTDIVGRSFYVEPEPPVGRFSKAFFLPLLRGFIARRKTLTEVNRHR